MNREYQKEIKIIKRNQREIWELRSKITEIIYSLEGFNSRTEQIERKTSESKYRSIENIQFEEQKKDFEK